MKARLGVNIDHVATVRQQRGEFYPDVKRAAEVILTTGAEQITIHLREDRRHIQDKDVPLVHESCKNFGALFNLEMGCTDEMVVIAGRQRPDWVCLVPEKRQEKTTEGGLDLFSQENFLKVLNTCKKLKQLSPGTKISLFVEADLEVLDKTLQIPCDAVEIHTGQYAIDFLQGRDFSHHLDAFEKAAKFLLNSGRGFHAGHGLTLSSLEPLLRQGFFQEYNIGHWIVAEAIFLGLGDVVGEMLGLIKKYPIKELK
jgi:pyridoxine 5-phosphate synthase